MSPFTLVVLLCVAGISYAEPNGVCPQNENENSTLTLLPDLDECSQFYFCVWGNPVLFNCSRGLHFNPNLGVCDWPENAGCIVGPESSGNEP